MKTVSKGKSEHKKEPCDPVARLSKSVVRTACYGLGAGAGIPL